MAPRSLLGQVYAGGRMGRVSRLDALEPPMRLAYAAAWEAFRAGSVPVGAVVTDGEGAVVTSGRARQLDVETEPGRIGNASIAIHRTAAPGVAALADDLVDSEERGGWPSLELEAVLEGLWPRLAAAASA